MDGWYDVVRETAEKAASWPLLGVALLFGATLLVRPAPKRVRLMMLGIILSMAGGWMQRTVFATRQWACRSIGPECTVVTGEHPFSVAALYMIAVGALLHYLALFQAPRVWRWTALAVFFLAISLALVPGLADPVYEALWPLVRQLAERP